jgi:hypothetical protein
MRPQRIRPSAGFAQTCASWSTVLIVRGRSRWRRQAAGGAHPSEASKLSVERAGLADREIYEGRPVLVGISTITF